MYKNELADAAGVAPRVLAQWLKPHAEVLKQMGVHSKTKLLNPAAVKYICETFVIELPEREEGKVKRE